MWANIDAFAVLFIFSICGIIINYSEDASDLCDLMYGISLILILICYGNYYY
jgi:hypothetical protein